MFKIIILIMTIQNSIAVAQTATQAFSKIMEIQKKERVETCKSFKNMLNAESKSIRKSDKKNHVNLLLEIEKNLCDESRAVSTNEMESQSYKCEEFDSIVSEKLGRVKRSSLNSKKFDKKTEFTIKLVSFHNELCAPLPYRTPANIWNRINREVK